jgi:hypothetical protein
MNKNENKQTKLIYKQQKPILIINLNNKMMKIFRNVFLMTAALVLGFTSCNNDDVPETGNGSELQALSFRITAGANPRAEGNAVLPNTVAQFNSGRLYLVTSLTGTVVRSYTIGNNGTPVGATYDIQLSEATATGANGGAIIWNVPNNANAAIFVANTASNVPVGASASVIRAQELDVLSQSTITNVNLYGESDFRPATADENNFHQGRPEYDGNDLKAVSIDLKPTVARIEMFDIVGNDWIHSFNVEGIFMDEYYQTGVVGGNAFTNLRDRGQGAIANNPLFTGTADWVVADDKKALHDWYASLLESSVWTSTVRSKVTPDKEVWGYNLFARRNVGPTPAPMDPAVRVPHIAIRLSEVMVYQGKLDTDGVTLIPNRDLPAIPHPDFVDAAGTGFDGRPMFVTIRGFESAPGTRVASFDAGNVYKLNPNTWAFGPEHVRDVVDEQDVDLIVRVTLHEWKAVPVTPIF